MIWDLVIAYFGITLAIAGWNIGILNCWPTPFAMILATMAAQMIYPNVCSWIIGQTRLPSDFGALIAYLILWLLLESAAELVLLIVVNRFKHHGVEKWERIGGAVVGFAKSVVVLLLATTISLHSENMPDPPDYPDFVTAMVRAADESRFLKDYRDISSNIPKHLQDRIISTAVPTFEPTWKEVDEPSHSERSRNVRSLVKSIRQFEQQVQQLGP